MVFSLGGIWRGGRGGGGSLLRARATVSGLRALKHARGEREGFCHGCIGRPPQPGQNGFRLSCMDPSSDVTEFLSSRRARITPEQAGLPSYGTRRVPGLRREEVASLAGGRVQDY